jgi:hypothetical protein
MPPVQADIEEATGTSVALDEAEGRCEEARFLARSGGPP